MRLFAKQENALWVLIILAAAFCSLVAAAVAQAADYSYTSSNRSHGASWQYFDSNDDTRFESGEWFLTSLSGDAEVPPVDTDMTGDMDINDTDDEGDRMEYELNVYDGDEVTMAHLHCKEEGENGPIVVTLFHTTDATDVDGLLSEGVIEDGDIEGTGADCDDPITDLDDLRQSLSEGRIYVNVHTVDHPAGEIRGQFEADSDDDDMNGSDGEDGADGYDGYDGNDDDDDGYHYNHDFDYERWHDEFEDRMEDARERMDERREELEHRMEEYRNMQF